MPIGINVKAEIKGLVKGLTRLEKREVPKAAAFALNRAARKARTQGKKEIVRQTKIKSNVVKEGMEIKKASWTRLTAFVKARGRPFNLFRFGAKQKKKGVSARVWEKRKTLKKTFIVNNKFVAVRKQGGGIRPVFGAGIVQHFIKKATERVMETATRAGFKKDFTHDLRRRISKL